MELYTYPVKLVNEGGGERREEGREGGQRGVRVIEAV